MVNNGIIIGELSLMIAAQCLHLADQIIVLNSNGTVDIQGTYEEVISEPRFMCLVKIQDQITVKEVDITHTERTIVPKPAKPADELKDLLRRTGDSSTYLYYIKTIGFSSWAIFVAVQMAMAFTDSFPQVWLNWWTSSGGQQLLLYLSIYATLALASILLLTFSIWILMLVIMPHSAIELHRRLLTTVMNAPQSFFAATDTGVTLNRFSQDMSLVDMALPIAVSGVASSIFACIAKVALISTGSSYMAITIPFTMIAIYVIQDVYLRTSRQLRFLDLENKSPIYSHFLETLEGLTTIRAFGWEHTSRQTQSKLLDLSQRPYYMLICVQRWLNLVLDLIVAILAVIVVALAVNLRSTTSAGLIGIALNNVLSFNQSLSSLVTSWTGLETSLGAIARTKSFTEIIENENLVGENFEPPKEWPDMGQVTFEGVSASYGDGTLALNDITMRIEPRQKIGICGRTGR
jgi:ATP-binding cassette subfamily C (CFTR/MRP) protein 1